MRRYSRRGAAIDVEAAKTLFAFIYWATLILMPPTPTNCLLLCGCHASAPAYAPLFAANKKSKQDDITINCCEPESGWLHGILIGGRGNRHSATCPNTLSGNKSRGEREPKIAICNNANMHVTSLSQISNEAMQKIRKSDSPLGRVSKPICFTPPKPAHSTDCVGIVQKVWCLANRLAGSNPCGALVCNT